MLTAAADKPDWLRLLAAAQDNSRRWISALRSCGTATRLLSLNTAGLRRLGLKATEIHALQNAVVPAEWSAWLECAGHGLIVYGDGSYPARLAEIADPPLALWVDGSKPELLGDLIVAIVGSRHPTTNGRRTGEALADALSAIGITVASGLALGIDAASHRGALRGPGSTVAVLGSGIDRIYPASNRGLAERIRAAGVLVSEYGPGHPVRAWQFPRRNRIIAALALGTIVVEATRRSGSLITAQLAAEFGREVFAVPGSIHSSLSKGCHKLIRDGAKLVETVTDIVVEISPQLSLIPDTVTPAKALADPAELPEILRDRLDFAPIGFDSLVSATGLTAGELSSMLLHLELQGKIEALPGGRYCRLAKRA